MVRKARLTRKAVEAIIVRKIEVTRPEIITLGGYIYR